MIDLSVIIPVKNEERNLQFCLQPLKGWAKHVIIVDSHSTDDTCKIAESFGAEVIQFEYQGGWPKKRQFVLDTYEFSTQWVMLLDSDEILTEASKSEINEAILDPDVSGYYLFFKMEFFGKMLRHSDPGLRKLSLFRTGTGGYEKRYQDQDESMADMEIHEHVIVRGETRNLKAPILHRNYNNMSRFIVKHDEYSNYEARVHLNGSDAELKAKFFGTKEQRRRYLKKHLIKNAWSPFFYFFYMFILRGGFRDGRPGFYYILYQCIYLYFVSSKMYEIEVSNQQSHER